MLLPPGHSPSPRTQHALDWTPFASQQDFLLADFLFRQEEMSAGNINHLMELWAFRTLQHQSKDSDQTHAAPFLSAAHMYATIDRIHLGGTPWECLKVSPNISGEENPPSWMRAEYEVWYRNVDHVLTEMLDNSDFKDKFDYRAFTYTDQRGQRRWSDFMSGNYAWGQSVRRD